jgi:hypothetical protein
MLLFMLLVCVIKRVAHIALSVDFFQTFGFKKENPRGARASPAYPKGAGRYGF